MEACAGNGAYLGNVSLDHSGTAFFQKPSGKLHTEITAGDAYQIYDSRTHISCQKNGFGPGIGDISQADSKGTGYLGNRGCFFGMLRHDRTCAQSQNCICTVIDYNGVGDAVD